MHALQFPISGELGVEKDGEVVAPPSVVVGGGGGGGGR